MSRNQKLFFFGHRVELYISHIKYCINYNKSTGLDVKD